MNHFSEKVSFIWSVADLLRGPYKPAQYGRVILPLTVLRRLDCVLEPTKEKVLAKAASLKGTKVENIEPILNRVAGQSFHNISRLDFQKLKGEPDKIAANLTRYIKSFSSKAREIIDYFGFEAEIARLDDADRPRYRRCRRYMGAQQRGATDTRGPGERHRRPVRLR